MIHSQTVLIVDEDRRLRQDIAREIEKDGHHIIMAASESEAINCIEQEDIDILIASLKGGRLDGMHLLEVVRHTSPNIEVILLTTQNTLDIDLGVQAMLRAGVSYCVQKPVNLRHLRAVVRRVLSEHELKLQHRKLQEQIDSRLGLAQFVGHSPAIQQVYNMIAQIAPTRVTVLIQGERGTGKELAARAIHYRSLRKGPLVTLNCAAIPETLVESELFGYERGAFTGAYQERAGRFEAADGGTLFLDEIGELSLPVQAKLLRAIEERVIERLGSTTPIQVDVRIVAATNRNLEIMVEQGQFRADLYDRLNVMVIRIPTLRERKEDIPILANAFIQEFSQENNKQIDSLSHQGLQWFMQYDWPGNVRELRNVIEGMVVMAHDSILGEEDIPERIRKQTPPRTMPTLPVLASHSQIPVHLGMTMKEIEREVLRATLKHVGGNRVKAAAMLKISKRTIYRKIKEYGLWDVE